MASLRETKDRITSVRGTLKITSAMKLVASSKLRKAQNAIEALRRYEESLDKISSQLVSAGVSLDNVISAVPSERTAGHKVVIAISSNSSLCGAFNTSVIKKTLELVGSDTEVIPLGRKMADAMKRAGRPAEKDLSSIVAHTYFDEVASLASGLVERYCQGEISEVSLVYNHFVSTSRQQVVVERFLPFPAGSVASAGEEGDPLLIIEPSPSEFVKELAPQVLKMKLYAAILDSAAAEHAARMVAMQTATDNAQDLIAALTLEYNKGRQQKITSEILDLVGGQAQ